MKAALASLLGSVFRGGLADNAERLLVRKAFQRGFANAHHPRYHGQQGQDMFLDNHVFHGRREGVFVDIGAYDGVTFSNTCFFERELGWTGLCIEPNPAAHARLCAQRASTCLNIGISDKEGDLAFLQLPGAYDLGSGFVDHYAPASLFARQPPAGSRRITVRTRRFMDVVGEAGLRRIDYLSIDTEGADFDILRSIDFAACSIEAVSVENSGWEERIATFMKARGYRLAAVLGNDDLYVRC